MVDASHLVAFAIKEHFVEQEVEAHLKRIAEVRGVSPESLDIFRDRVGRVINGMNAATRKARLAR